MLWSRVPLEAYACVLGLVTSEHAPTAKMSVILKREYPTAGGHLRNHGEEEGRSGVTPLWTAVTAIAA